VKVAIVSGPYVPVPPIKYGGTERVIFHLIKGLKELGHEPVLLGAGDSTVDCEIIPITKKSLFFPKDSSKIPEYNKKIREAEHETKKILKELLPKVDIIHSHKFDMKDFAHFPHIITLHDPIILEQNKYKNNFSIQYYIDRTDLNYVSISKNQQDSFPSLNYAGVVYNGEDPDDYPIIKKPNNYVCFVGRFDREKNPHMAIQLAINYGIKIKLAGKTDFAGNEYFNQEIKPYLRHPLVEYLGELGQKDVTKLLAHAKCNLHPVGFREPFGLTVLEAAYCGTPTLAVARGSMPELIKEGYSGMLVEDFVEGLHQIESCFSLDREYIAMRARRKFNYKNMARDYVKIYGKIINSTPKDTLQKAFAHL
jgi:glycosyltransferase involved in cell wall biosynthesis